MKSLLPYELQPSWSVNDQKSRRDRLIELAMAGYQIPECGTFDVMRRSGRPLVLYLDSHTHCGEGKVLYKGEQDPQRHTTGLLTFCSRYLPGYESEEDGDPAVSYRHLVVGSYRWEIRYESKVSWMANVGGNYSVLSCAQPVSRDHFDRLPYPMYAIDFTKTGCDYTPHDYHFDLNVCPGVPLEVVNELGRDVLTESVLKFCKDRGLV